MASITKRIFSASTDGAPILLTQTSTPGTLVHTAVTGTTDFDEVWIWCVNNHSADIAIEVEFGQTSALQNIVQAIPFNNGLHLVVLGLILQNAGTVGIISLVTGSVVAAYGYVNRITA